MIEDGLLFIIFLCEGIIIFLLCQLIDKVSEVNFNLAMDNLEYDCSKTRKDKNGQNSSLLEILELRKVISDYENTINQLKKNQKQLKKGNKTLQKNNQKLAEEIDCLKRQLYEPKKSDSDKWSVKGVIYE